ncbi:Uncharacterized protein TCM_026210 [Theobroma cacao]|uniref:Uncharacterized protein n=1 Tax=Theobroma cacao TaxID=3641 RepID=A0A061F2M1_THECC|nr:Uncharacterized protein TCM_026210 [Theobroma cacao]
MAAKSCLLMILVLPLGLQLSHCQPMVSQAGEAASQAGETASRLKKFSPQKSKRIGSPCWRTSS